MGWRTVRDIEAWNHSMKLQSEFFAVLDRSPANTDRRFCDDVRDAVASAARNLAEGFGRYGDAEFAKFVNIAIGSLTETYTNLVIATDRRYVSAEESQRLLALC